MEITTISTKKFLLIGLLSIPFILFLSIGLAVFTETKEFAFLVIPGLGLAIYFGQKHSKITTKINLDNQEYLAIDREQINYSDILGYFKNETGLSQSTLSLRLNTNKSIHIVCSSIGKEGKKFKEIEKQIISQIKSQSPTAVELEYQDIYVKQMNIMRPILIGLAGLVIIIDIITIYALITGHFKLPWQIFFVNFLLIGMLPYLKRRKQLMPTAPNSTWPNLGHQDK